MTLPAAFCRDEVASVIPHRDHALFVEDVRVDGWTVQGSARWSVHHPHVQGHFPGRPLVPGIFLLEAAAQLGGVAICHNSRDVSGVLASVRRCHFHRQVLPGERVDYVLSVSAMPGMRMYSVAGQGRVGELKTVSVDVVLAALDEDSLDAVA